MTSRHPPAPAAPPALVHRRTFLGAAVCAPALAVAAASEGAQAAAAPEAPEEAGRPQGYHVTEHILQYYATAAYW